jgi:hypothetical protein
MIQSGVPITGPVYPNRVFPENAPPVNIPAGTAGIAICGGGTRSASMAAGQLRALIDHRKFTTYRYVSMVSGGTWGTWPLFFLQNPNWIGQYLGTTVPPGQLTPEMIADTSGNLVATASTHAFPVVDTLGHMLDGADAYSNALGEIFLKDVGLNDLKFFTWDATTRAAIAAAGLQDSDFHTVLTNWPHGQTAPFPIAGGTLKHPVPGVNLHVEITPLNVGVSGTPPPLPPNFGGGSIAPPLFGTVPQAGAAPGLGTGALSKIGQAFTVRDVLGISGCAPGAIMSLPWFPNYPYWSPTLPHGGAPVPGYEFVDGGTIENLGIMPLLRRGCLRIVLFVNAEYDIAGLNMTRWLAAPATPIEGLDDAIAPLFIPAQNRVGGNSPGQNIVLGGGQAALTALVTALHDKALSGDIVSYTADYPILANGDYGVTAYGPVTITWVYNSMPSAWLNALPLNTQRDSANTWRRAGRKPFPFLATFEESIPFIINYTPQEANMLGHLTDWVTNQLILKGEI